MSTAFTVHCANYCYIQAESNCRNKSQAILQRPAFFQPFFQSKLVQNLISDLIGIGKKKYRKTDSCKWHHHDHGQTLTLNISLTEKSGKSCVARQCN